MWWGARDLAAGNEPFDEGSDVLLIDPSAAEITGRIDLGPAMAGEASAYLPRADRAVLIGERAYVLLGSYSSDMLDSAPSRVVSIDPLTDELDEVLVLDGLHGCAGMTVAPGSPELAIACSGRWEGSVAAIAHSGVVRVAVAGGMQELQRYPASSFGEGAVGAGISYASPGRLLFVTFGRFAAGETPAADDTLIELDLESGQAHVLLRSAETPFTLGDVRCSSACEACFVTDAARSGGVVHRFDVTAGGLSGRRTIKVEQNIGLPPRQLGGF